MSSSSSYRPSQLHHVNLHSNGKRPFEECGYDSDTPLNNLQASGSGSSASSSRFSSNSSSSGEGRNKRARSNSTSSHSSSSDASRSTGYDTAHSSARSDLSLDASSTVSRDALNCPIRPSPAFVPQEQQLSDLVVDRHRPVSPPRVSLSTSQTSEEHLRASLERFNEFDRQMAALRSSFAASHSSVLPPVAPSFREDTPGPRDDWAAMSSSFLSMSSNGRPASDASDAASTNATIAPSETLHSLSTFGSSDGSSLDTTPSTSEGGVSFASAYRYPPYPPYRPTSRVSSSAVLDLSGNSTISVDQSSNQDGPQSASPSSDSLSSSHSSLSPPPGLRLRPVRRTPSPLVLNPQASSAITAGDPFTLRYEHVAEGSRSPRGWLGRNGPDGGASHGSSFQPVSSDAVEAVDQRPAHVVSSRPRSGDALLRVFRQHSVEREPAPSVFDVFGIGDSAHERNLHRRSSSSPAREHHTSQSRASGRLASTVEPSTSSTRVSSSETRDENARIQGYQPARSDFHSRLYSGSTWAAIPASNSLVTESATEQRRAQAPEQFRDRRRLSSLDTDDEGERLLGMLHQPAESQPPSPDSLSPDASYPLNELQGGLSLEGARLLSGRRENGINRADRVSSQPSPAPRGGPSGLNFPPELESSLDLYEDTDLSGSAQSHLEDSSSFSASSSTRERSPTRPSSQRPRLQPDGLSTSSGSYSYNNLNLSSFQSGMFRDSLRRNAEINRLPNQSSGPTIPRSGSQPMSELTVEDNESAMNIDDEMALDRLVTLLREQHGRRSSNTTRDTQPQSRRPLNLNRPSVITVPRTLGEGAEPSERHQYSGRGAEASRRINAIRNPYRFDSGDGAQGRRTLETLQPQDDDAARRDSIDGAINNPTVSSNNALHEDFSDNTDGRRSFGGSIRQRWARFAGLSSSGSVSASGDGSSSAALRPQRAQPHPVGARPQVAERRRASLASMPMDIDEPRPFDRSETQAVNPPAEAPSRRDFPWRPFVSGPRSSFPSSSSWGNAAQEQDRVEPGPMEEPPSRLRTLRQRFQLDRGDGPRASRPAMLRAMMSRRNLGDYVPDELFDSSYEALLSLSNAIGEARSKATPDDVIASLPTSTFQEWAKEDSETRCPICLDDYEPLDAVTKLLECPHWLHKKCLEQWLKTANTCPVCRKKVKTDSPVPARRFCPHRRDYTGPVSGPSSSQSGGSGSTANIHLRPLYLGSFQNGSTAAGSTSSAESSIPPRRAFRPVLPPPSGRAQGPQRIQHHVAISPQWLEMQNELHDHVSHPVHPPSHIHPHHHHVHTHTHHFHPAPAFQSSFRPPPAPPTSMFPPSRNHAQVSDSGRTFGVQRPSLMSSGSASEQLIVPHAPTPEDGVEQAPRNAVVFPRDMHGRTGRPPPATSGSTNTADGISSSFTIAPSSSVTFSGPSNGASTSSSRDDRSTFVITNSTGNPVVVTNRMSNGRSFTTSLHVEPANTSQLPTSSVRPGPAAFTWDFRRPHPGSNSRENADPTSSNADPWWLG